MKNACLFLLVVFGISVANSFADEPKSYRIVLTRAKIGTAEIPAGDYALLVHPDGAEGLIRLTEMKSGGEIELPARVESADRKFDKTEIHSREANGARQITEIRIGGTSLRIAFEHGS